MYHIYRDPAEDFVLPNDPIHILFESVYDMCFHCANAIVYPGYAGSLYEPPEDPSVHGCKACNREGGTMPNWTSDEFIEGIPTRLCPWFSQQFQTEDVRKHIRCPSCNSPRMKYVMDVKLYLPKNSYFYDDYRDSMHTVFVPLKCKDCGTFRTVDETWFYCNSLVD